LIDFTIKHVKIREEERRKTQKISDLMNTSLIPRVEHPSLSAFLANCQEIVQSLQLLFDCDSSEETNE